MIGDLVSRAYGEKVKDFKAQFSIAKNTFNLAIGVESYRSIINAGEYFYQYFTALHLLNIVQRKRYCWRDTFAHRSKNIFVSVYAAWTTPGSLYLRISKNGCEDLRLTESFLYPK